MKRSRKRENREAARLMKLVEMRIWILRRPAGMTKLDQADGFVVRAWSAHLARRIAADSAGDEGPAVWLDPKQSTCRNLTPAGRGWGGVVMRDFNNG